MGHITIQSDYDIEVYIEDIISELDGFDNDELKKLKEEIELKLNKTNIKPNVLEPTNLEEEFKVNLLKEFYDKFSWSELEDIKKKIM